MAVPKHARRARPLVNEAAEQRVAPFVSVILPVRNESTHIRACLHAIIGQDYPADRMEIFVIDGGSTDGTKGVVEALAAEDRRVKLLDDRDGNIPTALNVGTRAATGEVIIRVDGHTFLASDYVRQCVAALERTGAANVGGAMRPRGDTSWGQAVALATTSPFGIGNGAFHDATRDDDSVDTVYLGAFRRSALDAIGGYDAALTCNEDDELNFRLRAAGHRIALSSAIQSTYVVRSTPQQLWRQYWRYGNWKVRVIAKQPGSLQWRHAVPPIFAAALLTTVGLRLRGAAFRHLWLAVALPWSLGSLLATARLAHQAASPVVIAELPAVFATLHLSYGLGFLWGLATWLIHGLMRQQAEPRHL